MPARARLWYGFLGGPVAWSAHLLASYPLVPIACERGSPLVLNLVTGATLLLALGAATAAWLALRRLRRGGEPGADAAAHRRALFMARFGVWTSVLFAFVILVEGLPPLLQDPCLAVG